ncbi:DUF721 domain-containing protein [Pseudodesulfovibrio cashew]|uniref:DUF721 domain-containing protein n=1 Tax=Pseudodesulfovibrio cashew TaxID=2678688 RepID=A0A6I6JJC3_9BACT|nr:DUF721 domain-containing protein [Pseudodesulfovibrio cashew]QGY40412.1 DUF721 domain-containing protein [Pseudodesulfovibrio cashew]
MVRYYRHYTKKGRANRVVSTRDALPRFLDKLDTTGGMALIRLWEAWGDLMGEMASVARPLGHRGRRLILAAEDPMVMQEAQFLAPMILEIVNGFLGQEIFDKVVFELLNGRTPLDGAIRREAPEPPRKLKKPEKLGGLDEDLDPDSPLGRCYRAYRRMFEEK